MPRSQDLKSRDLPISSTLQLAYTLYQINTSFLREKSSTHLTNRWQLSKRFGYKLTRRLLVDQRFPNLVVVRQE